MDVASWLRSLGLEQYEATFRDNAIDDSVLPDLTDQDLEKLGVLLGHRRKLLRAIANIEATAQTASSAVGGPVAVDVSPRDSWRRELLLPQFRECRFDPFKHGSGSQLRKYTLCLFEVLNREHVSLFYLIQTP